jgi:flagellar protein FliO/FliZ
MSAYASYLIETFVTLVAVCAIAVFVLYGARKVGMGRSSGGIELVGRLPLDARRSIVLVRVGAQVFLVGVGEGGFTKLGEMSAADLPPPAVAEPNVFAQALARAMSKRPPPPESASVATAKTEPAANKADPA